jgi:hypothetical protein
MRVILYQQLPGDSEKYRKTSKAAAFYMGALETSSSKTQTSNVSHYTTTII